MTENGVVTITRPGDPPEVVADSDGTPVPWMQIAGRRRRRQAGAAWARPGGCWCGGRARRPATTSAPSCTRDCLSPADDGGDPWFDTGDLAWRRDDGGIRIAGRSKDLVIRGGENVPVVEVEAVLYTHPQVREVAVVGYPDDRLGERACAVVVVEAEVGRHRYPGRADGAWLDRTAWPASSGPSGWRWSTRCPRRRRARSRSSTCASASSANDRPRSTRRVRRALPGRRLDERRIIACDLVARVVGRMRLAHRSDRSSSTCTSSAR